jgi:hypothetical protein
MESELQAHSSSTPVEGLNRGEKASVLVGLRPTFRLMMGNLALLLFLAFALSAWIIVFTDFFPIVSTLLSLGGIFAWAGFLSNLLSERTKKKMQIAFESRMLGTSRTWKWAATAGAIFLAWASCHGTLILDSVQEEKGRDLKILEAGNENPFLEETYLPAHEAKKYLLFVSFWGKRTFRVKASGLPSKEIAVRALSRERVSVPGWFFEQSILFLRPASEVSGTTEKANTYTLQVSINAKSVALIKPYFGQAVWLGCESSVAIPQSLIARWSLDLKTKGIDESAATRWLTPLAVKGVSLKPLDRVEAAVLRADGGTYAWGHATVESTNVVSWPQEVILDVRPSH